MDSLLEKLEAYFAANTREKILEDWERTADFDKVGVIAKEFMSGYTFSCVNSNRTEYNCSPEETSGYFLIKKLSNYAKCATSCFFNNKLLF